MFEITDKAGNVVDTIRSNSRGLAISKQLPLSRYFVREVKAPEHYGISEKELTVYLEYEGQIARLEVEDKSLSTGVSITKTGPKEIMGKSAGTLCVLSDRQYLQCQPEQFLLARYPPRAGAAGEGRDRHLQLPWRL